MSMMRYIFFLLAILMVWPCVAQAQEASLDNLPLPRWAVLASKELNLRTGPGKRYPIDWVLHKKGLPVEIRQEFDSWRLIHEPGGAEGWVHRTMLSSVRNGMIRTKDQSLYAKPATDSHVVARLQENVITHVRHCQPEWCEVEIESYKGWVPKDALWGIYPKETFE